MTKKLNINHMRKAGKILRAMFAYIQDFVEPGITTEHLDRLAHRYIEMHGGTAACIGYHGYKHATCISVNNEVCHVPPADRQLLDGDIVTIDCVISYKGHHVDAAKTFVVGSDDILQTLNSATFQALSGALAYIKAGTPIKVVGEAIEVYTRFFSLGVIEGYGGHGIGLSIHELPLIPNKPQIGSNGVLEAGKCYAIEPLLTTGSGKCHIGSDGWSVYTNDGHPVAHWEHTILVTKDGCEILT